MQRENYQVVSDKFIDYYYHQWNTNYPLIKNLYSGNVCITYFGNKYNNFDNVLQYLITNKVNKLDFNNFKSFAQPLGDDKILIHILGSVCTNGNIFYRKFSEIIILQRDIWNKYYIINNIFSLVD